MSSIRALSPKAETKRLSMSRASAAQTVLPLGDQPQAVHGWDQLQRDRHATRDRYDLHGLEGRRRGLLLPRAVCQRSGLIAPL